MLFYGQGHRRRYGGKKSHSDNAGLAVTREDAMWYVIQTMTGKEEELVAGIHAVLAGSGYQDCFVIKAEWLKRLGGRWRLQVCPLFPGYVFMETNDPERIFLDLKQVPKFSRILGSGAFEFTAVEEEEKRLLERLCGMGDEKERQAKRESRENQEDRAKKRWVVRLTEAAVEEDGTVTFGKGPLTELEYFTGLKTHREEIAAALRPGSRESGKKAGRAEKLKETQKAIKDIEKEDKKETEKERNEKEQTDGKQAKAGQADGIRVVLHKRFAVASLRLLGKDRTLMLGIRLKKDQGHIK